MNHVIAASQPPLVTFVLAIIQHLKICFSNLDVEEENDSYFGPVNGVEMCRSKWHALKQTRLPLWSNGFRAAFLITYEICEEPKQDLR